MAIIQMILFLMADPTHSGLAKATQESAAQRYPQGHVQRQSQANTAFQTLAAP
ncbi:MULTISPECIES: hypothetical protein [Pseudomonas]|uniref:hypothetical protein n=1 Tax=Pseudomonas TaxID=286 RepID=UPI0012D3D546|nr:MULTISPECIES: hypothetical protein [Pseudomonas]MBA5982336.1 hypothetical protein [Pseudomonas sp. MD195_PC81_125]QXE08688.1 hypothetical protein GTQ41_06330 [Pseudomonas sp. AN-B15]QXZ13108.1 hypothetical protein KVQ82_23995 [Pseudomonas sp. AO-1]ULN82483.1 hypothetical protein HXW87_09940 [Pseudomonas sp. Y5-11]